jgi:signal peptidase I
MKISKTLYDIAWAFTVAMLLRLVFGFFLGTSFPFVAVMSSSMTHDAYVTQNYYSWMAERGFSQEQLNDFSFRNGFGKGDALIIGSPKNVEVGDVIVYVNPDLGYAIIHRVIGVTESGYVTKGDRNPSSDPWVVKTDWVKGRAVVLIPFVGWIRVLPTDIFYFFSGGPRST